MKKVFLMTLVLMLGGIFQLSAQNPIPSYNTPVNHVANFQELVNSPDLKSTSKGQRVLQVKVKGSSAAKATIWVYSHDNQDILGPFIVYGGETISVSIDDRLWGVIVHSDSDIDVDVWIEEQMKGSQINRDELNEPFPDLNAALDILPPSGK